MFPATFGLACCAIEMMSIVAARLDAARFGFEAFRASPRQADLLILSGRVSHQDGAGHPPHLRPDARAQVGDRDGRLLVSSMGVFNNYAIVPADKFMPVDVHVPGCPPRPEALMHGILKLRKQIQDDPDQGWRARYGGEGTEELLPALDRRRHGRPREAVDPGARCLTRPASS